MQGLQLEEQLFHAALELPAAERQAYLERSTHGDQALLARLNALLLVHDQHAERPKLSALEQFLTRGALGLRLGKYEVVREIGRGGFGLVFLAHDTTNGAQVALKVPRPEMLFSSDARRRFLAEAKTVAGLQHPNVVRVLDVGEADEVCYIAAEYCPGPSLDRWLLQDRLTPWQAAQLIEHLARALHYVHGEGVLHRDLKPSNILLWPAPRDADDAQTLAFKPQLTDFGLAKFVEQSLEETGSSILMGTPLYMAPEQADCRHDEQGAWTDVYGLGAILYQLLVGSPPFAGGGLLSVLHRVRNEPVTSPRKLRSDIPADLDNICRQCLAKEPPDRYRTAEELAEDLARFQRGERVHARSPRIGRRIQLWLQQPERMRDAGIWAMMLNLGMTIWMMGNLVAVRLISEWTTEELLSQSDGSLFLTFGFHVPQFLLGWLILRRHGWAMLANALVSVSLLVAALSPFFATSSHVFTGMYPNRLSLWNVHWFLSILFAAEATLSGFAWLAYRRWRKSSL